MYYIVKDRARDYSVRFSRFGCGSEIITSFTTRRAAQAWINAKYKQGVA